MRGYRATRLPVRFPPPCSGVVPFPGLCAALRFVLTGAIRHILVHLLHVTGQVGAAWHRCDRESLVRAHAYAHMCAGVRFRAVACACVCDEALVAGCSLSIRFMLHSRWGLNPHFLRNTICTFNEHPATATACCASFRFAQTALAQGLLAPGHGRQLLTPFDACLGQAAAAVV